jgi:hypothetical protein
VLYFKEYYSVLAKWKTLPCQRFRYKRRDRKNAMFNAEWRENILREKLKDKRIKFKLEQRIYEIYGR